MINCRFCKTELSENFANLGMTPVSNAFIPTENRFKPEIFYPLATFVCKKCFLVQAIDFESAEHHFHGDYIYFSSFSDSWIAHAKAFVEKIIPQRQLSKNSQVIELASNDGYLLQHFIPHGIPILGIEPSKNVAEVAEKKGVPSLVKFFGTIAAKELLQQGKQSDLVIANNVLAHVPDIQDFVAGVKILLKPHGIATFEFPWLYELIANNQFDTIYHEHYSYLSMTFLEKLFSKVGLVVFDIENLPTHGGSLRLYVKHLENTKDQITAQVGRILLQEAQAELTSLAGYKGFQNKVEKIKCEVLSFLIQAKRENKKVIGYGAPAKGNTLLNYCGVGPELMSFTVDRSPHKQGKLLPGSHIPVKNVAEIFNSKPDYIFVLPWNLKDEVMAQMTEARSWGCQFVVPIPRLEVLQ